MLDGRDEKKPYSAVTKRVLEDGKESTITMHFTAANDEEAQRFLIEGGYVDYKLILLG
jgi:hypothetical protein